MQSVLFGRLGKILFILVVIILFVTAFVLPYIMAPLNLVFPEKWAVATRSVVQITFGAWIATSVVSIARIVVWLRAVYSFTSSEEYTSERSDVTYVRDFTLWLLGILTTLAAFMTAWVSGA
jgi:hypothetical protein